MQSTSRTEAKPTRPGSSRVVPVSDMDMTVPFDNSDLLAPRSHRSEGGGHDEVTGSASDPYYYANGVTVADSSMVSADAATRDSAMYGDGDGSLDHGSSADARGMLHLEHVIRMKMQLRQTRQTVAFKKAKDKVLEPKGLPRLIWDCFNFILLVYSLFEIPFALSFLGSTCEMSWREAFNLFIDIFFCCDIGTPPCPFFRLSMPVEQFVYFFRRHAPEDACDDRDAEGAHWAGRQTPPANYPDPRIAQPPKPSASSTPHPN